jgi:pimeloyl-ACP methyl ester carboxylesterase
MNLGAIGRIGTGRSLFGVLVGAAAAVSLSLPATAQAAVPAGFTPCPNVAGFYCGTVTVPLDRSGQVIPVTTTISLRVMFKPAQVADTDGALVALAGGPGQAATPFATDFATALAPALGTRDLVVFDQRGTGASGALSCPGAGSATSIPNYIQTCAAEIGPARAYYTSKDSAEDLDAVRTAIGADKITVFGVSYGTYVAQLYARLFPDHTAALVLDSVVPSTGVDVFLRSNFQALPKVLSANCSSSLCKGITGTPYSDLKRLVRRATGSKALKLRYVDANGNLQTLSATQLDLFNFMPETFTFDAVARARFPAAVRSARAGDPYPLGRLLAPTPPSTSASEVSTALYWSTTCAETAFPWVATDPLATREQRATSALASIPASTFSPFTPEVALDSGNIPWCVYWPAPQQPIDPSVTEPLPNVPVLVLDGQEDDLTPASDGAEVAALFPQASRVEVPFTGHSVITDTWPNADTCVERSISSFFAALPVASCNYVTPFFRPTKIDPVSLAEVKPVHFSGIRGETVGAILGTLSDVTMTELSGMENNSGLRGGRFTGPITSLHLDKVVYVPGVTVSGRFDVVRGKATLTIGGSGEQGKVVVSRYKKFTIVSGKLDGKRFGIKTKTSANDSTVAARLPGLLGLSLVTRPFTPIPGRGR